MKFGLIGYPLGHSFSKAYFTTRFEAAGYDGFLYDNYELSAIQDVLPLLHGDVLGFNVTIPYKTAILEYLNDIDETAFKIQAVNTMVRSGPNSWKGYNTDVIGFRESLIQWLGNEPLPHRALVLGAGGSAKAVCHALQNMGIAISQVSRKGDLDFTYTSLDTQTIEAHPLIINATPLGMEPHLDTCPDIPYADLTSQHWLYDLVYNPVNTLFLTRGQQAGARTKNGLDMLRLQADHAWAIWKKYGKF